MPKEPYENPETQRTIEMSPQISAYDFLRRHINNNMRGIFSWDRGADLYICMMAWSFNKPTLKKQVTS